MDIVILLPIISRKIQCVIDNIREILKTPAISGEPTGAKVRIRIQGERPALRGMSRIIRNSGSLTTTGPNSPVSYPYSRIHAAKNPGIHAPKNPGWRSRVRHT